MIFLKNYFIHTIEFFKPIETEIYKAFKNNTDYSVILNDNIFIDEYLVNNTYSPKGLIIELHKCTPNEIMTYRKPCKLVLKVNPSKLIYEGEAINHITDKDTFKMAFDELAELIDSVFTESDLNDIDEYTIDRIDITRDVHGIPEDVIKEVNTMLYRMPMYDGYAHNTQLEKYCKTFRREDSFNAVNYSRGIEFVIYNKHQAAIDNHYDLAAVDHYKDTLRIELRCNKKYINKHFIGKNIRKTLLNAYDNMKESVEEIYFRLFKFPTSLCHLPSKLLIKYIFDRCDNKKAKCRRMVTLLDELDKYKQDDLQTALNNVYLSEKRQRKIKEHYEEYGVSPLTTRVRNIPFIQSLDSLLEFEKPTGLEYDLFRTVKEQYSEVFFHEPIR